MNPLEMLIEEALAFPPSGIAYHAGRRLRELFPGRAVVDCATCGFDLDAYAEAGLATVTPHAVPSHQQMPMQREGCGPQGTGPRFLDDGGGLMACDAAVVRRPRNAWLRVAWQGRELDCLRLTWGETMTEQVAHLLVADTLDAAESFYRAVTEWSAVPHGEVLVYEKGGWQKDRALFKAIRGTTFESLVLAPGLKEGLRSDLEQFFAHREMYARYGVPWKRGVLLVGPPGNGKTHAVKALCHMLGRPALYVRSLEPTGRFFGSEHANIAQVFELARLTAPCLLVLEDLDAMVKPDNRSVFLNQLDGFADNTGLCVIATTNYPERLDPAILDRPSRFDRKYHFPLPGADERLAYLRHWNAQQTRELRLTESGLAEVVNVTTGFSYAYLKELCLSLAMAWINTGPGQSMDPLALEQASVLARQMSSAPGEASAESGPTASIPGIERALRGAQ